MFENIGTKLKILAELLTKNRDNIGYDLFFL